ncbi:L-type lectin-domain containing receptor kinase SIT2-like [Dioscorea cayenensis subsp. rotundata]|uniref:non-specific serine/threonine protein kinase n=1 Tax=Dioscorea cayennensis subsp. rotundata TaxID=55577 RepID=A0AB40CDB3_DIOCR|nr:L-type lectin-domain containing receptor kinase SIT2-like [Dioscorea cayenensis subsp. rotundata]
MVLKIFTWVLLLKLAFSANDGFTYNGFNSANLSLDGLAALSSDGLLKLTNVSKHAQGHAFFSLPLQFKKSPADSVISFSTTFVFAIVPEYPTFGGAGFTFVLSPSKDMSHALPNYFLGLFNMTNNGKPYNHILAVEFDTSHSPEAHDIDNNHVGIDINGLISNQSAPAAFKSDADGQFKNLSLSSGKPIQVWIEYDGIDMQLNVTLSPLWMPKPKGALLSLPINLSSIILDHMYVGFSASTGIAYSYYYILGWSFKMYGEVPELNLSSLPSLPQPLTSFEKSKALSIWLPIFLSILVLVTAAILKLIMMRKKKFSELQEDWELDLGSNRFSYKQLYKATGGFKDKYLLGAGGFGRVYRGVLPASKVEVAVKRISHESRQGVREFVAEIASLGKLRHRNLVQLLGYCRRKGELLLVYEYMPNGSLDNNLFGEGRQALNWGQRFHIIKGVASGLQYFARRLGPSCDS